MLLKLMKGYHEVDVGRVAREYKIEISINIPTGDYNLSIGLIAKHNKKPVIKLAIEGQTSEC